MHALSPQTFNSGPSAPAKAPRSRRRKFLRALTWLLLLPFFLVLLTLLLVYLPPVQNTLRGKAVSFLEAKTGTTVRLDHFNLRFPLGVTLEGLFVADEHGDTLLHAGTLKAQVGLRALFNKRILLTSVEFADVRATVVQFPDSSFNFDFIIAGFTKEDGTPTQAPADTSGGFDFAMEGIELHEVVFDMDLQPSGLAMDVQLGELAVAFDLFQLDPMRFHVDDLVLENTQVHLRTTSGDPAPSTYPALVNPLAELDVRFNAIELNDVSFTMKTVDSGDSLWLAMENADITSRDMDLTQQRLALEELDVDGVRFGMIAAQSAAATDTAQSDPPWLDQRDGFRYWLRDWDIAVHRLRLARSAFALHTDRVVPPAVLFDPEHLVFTDIEMDAEGLVLNNERVAMELRNLHTRGGPMNAPLALAMSLDATPEQVSIRNATVKALEVELAFQGEITPGDLAAAYRAPNDVPISAEVRTALRMSELVPLLRQVGVELPPAIATNEQWITKATYSGTAQRADRIGVDLTGDQGSRIRSGGSVRGLDQWPQSIFDVRVDELIMGSGLRQVVLAYMPPDILLPQRLALHGTASGASGTMRAVVDLDSDLGNVAGSAVVSGWSGSIPNNLQAEINVVALDLGRIIGDTALDPVSMKLSAVGEGLNGATRSGSLSATPSVLMYAGNDLSSLQLHAGVLGDSINADLDSKAEALYLHLNAKGTWPRTGDSLELDLDLALRKLGFKELGLTEHALNTDGRITGRIAFANDGFGRVGLRAEGLRLFNASREFRFERFALRGLLASDSTAIDLDSDALTAAYHTNLRADSLLPNAQARFERFFNADSTIAAIRGQQVDFTVALPRTEWLTEFVLPDLDAIDLRTFRGHYDGDLDEFALHMDVPHLDYAGVDVHELVVDVDAVNDRSNGAVSVARVERDSLFVENLSLDVVNAGNGFDATLRIRHAERERYRIATTLRREDGVRVLRMGDYLLLNYNTWAAHAENALRLTDDGVRAEHFELSSGAERVGLRTGAQRTEVEFTAFQLTTIAALVSSTDSVPLVSGAVDGSVNLPYVEGAKLNATATITNLFVLGVELGTLSVEASELETGHYHAETELKHSINALSANIDADLGGTSAHVRADADLAFGDLSFLKPFVAEYLYTVEGGLKGALRYEQDGATTKIIGRTTITDGAVGLIQTGATYRLPKEIVAFTGEGIVLDNMTVLDSAGNRFRLDGKVLTAAGKVPALDLRLRTDRFQLVNSTMEQNAMFFGDLFCSVDLRIDGTATNPGVHGDVGVLDGTALSLVLPGSRVELVEHEGIVVFTTEAEQDTLEQRTDSELLRDSLAAQLPGVELDLRIKLDKGAQFAVVIDPTTGDQATFSGDADLVFRYAPNGDMYLSGPFTVADGGYTVSFYGMVKKRFVLVPGGTVIWSGDPLAGVMDIQARYRSESAPYPLVANAKGGLSESERNRLQTRLPFDVLINIREAVNTPVISFGLDLDRLNRNNYQSVSNRLDQLAQAANEEELNRQVFGLLVLNTFIEDVPATGQPGSNLATTAARNSVNSILTDQLNGLTGQMVKGMDVQLGVNTYEQTDGGEAYQRTTVDYKVTQRILNDRVSIEAGGSIGADERNQTVSGVTNNRAAQYAIGYDLSPDGRLRLRAFHENAYDLYDGEIINNGFAITLTRDFEQDAKERERRRAVIRQQREAIRNKEE